MRRIFIGILTCVFLLTSCGHQLTWQEQYDLGVRYLSEGNYEEAIIAFTAAIEIDPKRVESYSGLAEAYTCTGDLDAARRALEDGLAATGSEIIKTLLDEMEKSTAELPSQFAEEIAANGVSGSLDLSNVAYRYEEGGEMAELNDGAVGGLYLSFTAHNTDNVLIAACFDEMPGDAERNEMIDVMVSIWKDNGRADHIQPAQDFPADLEQCFPVSVEELGRTEYVLLIGLDEQYNALGYAIVPVKIPG